MICKQVAEIIIGQKTETRRVRKPNEQPVYNHLGEIDFVMNMKSRRRKWYVGQVLSIQSRRGGTGLWYRVGFRREDITWAEINLASGYTPLKIVVKELRLELLQDIKLVGAQREGAADISAYAKLWDEVQPTKHTLWECDPDVWVIRFALHPEQHKLNLPVANA